MSSHQRVKDSNNRDRNQVINEELHRYHQSTVATTQERSAHRYVRLFLMNENRVAMWEDPGWSRQHQGQHPDPRSGHNSQQSRGHVPAHGSHDGVVPLHAESGEREDGHSDRDVLRSLRELADVLPPRPRLERVDDGDEGDAGHDHQQISQGEAEDVDVGDVPHLAVSEEDQDEGAVADHSDDEDEDEQCWDKVCLEPAPVGDVLGYIRLRCRCCVEEVRAGREQTVRRCYAIVHLVLRKKIHLKKSTKVNGKSWQYKIMEIME